MNQVAVSVIIPVYNAEKWIRKTLQSVLNQTQKPLEILLINDGSSDNSYQSVAEFSDHFQWIDLLNQGLPKALNIGIERAKGEIISFLDADDSWMPQKLEIQAEFLAQNPKFHAVSGYVEMVSESGSGIQVPAVPQPGMLRSCFSIRKSVFQTVGGFSDQYTKGEFIDWIVRFQEAGFIYQMLDMVLAQRLLHRQGISGGNDFSGFTELIKAKLDRARR